ncbi:MAG TPA: SRPBCC family protein [Actinophytocola sp.]|uniref:SRPBCC family protein n=1 Tax=Actinophytocola sp. TaxID=1872138 RepID=UPI002DBBB7CE|nr:SRPBCC family protein [Actinophytocola sp.]HEU5470829.1 SRPBCC family protein [Actinophytocola sp.]
MPEPRRFTFEVTARSSAAPATLFALEADGSQWSRWALIPHSFWERQGDPAPAGIGAVRALGLRPLLVREETVTYEPDRRHAYVMRSRMPVRDYRGELELTPRPDGGTDLVWRGSFTELVRGSGPVARAALRLMIVLLARRLVRFAERGSAR